MEQVLVEQSGGKLHSANTCTFKPGCECSGNGDQLTLCLHRMDKIEMYKIEKTALKWKKETFQGIGSPLGLPNVFPIFRIFVSRSILVTT